MTSLARHALSNHLQIDCWFKTLSGEYQIKHQSYVLLAICKANSLVTARFYSQRAVTWKRYIPWRHHNRIWLVSAKPVFTHVTGNTNVTEGNDVTFQCQTDGVPAATPEWLVDGEKLSSAWSVYISIYKFSQEFQYNTLHYKAE